MGKANRRKRRTLTPTYIEGRDGRWMITCPTHGTLTGRATSRETAILSMTQHLRFCHGTRPIITHPGRQEADA